MDRPPVCSYEDSDYQASFWDQGGRAYEDAAEAIALRHLLPASGQRMLELGAGAGRNTPRYTGYEQVVLVDYSLTQLQQAQKRLGEHPAYRYVAANVYHLPFALGAFDGATMIRTLHHMADPAAALHQVRDVLQPGSIFILEFANKRNLKAILRWLFRLQDWDPFALEAVEFAALNFDFHPRAVREWLNASDFLIEKIRTVSHFRAGLLKKLVPTRILAGLDGILQPTGNLWQYTPSVFIRSRAVGEAGSQASGVLFRCPACCRGLLQDTPPVLTCPECSRTWPVTDGIYDFRVE